MRCRLRMAAIVIATALSGGCCLLHRGPGPVPPPLPREQVVQTLRGRADRFVSVVDTGISLSIQVETQEGIKKQPTLGGLLAFDSLRPGLWLRAEKLGQKVFNLRADAERFWLEIPDTREVVVGSREAYSKLPQLIEPYEVMFWFGSPEWLGLTWDSTLMALEPEHYRFDVMAGSLLMRSVFVDRRRLVISRIVDYDLLGSVSTEVLMDRHKETSGVPFPRRLTVIRPQVGYRIELRLGNPRFNTDIDPGAFRPGRRPGWRQIDLDREPLSSVEAFRGDP